MAKVTRARWSVAPFRGGSLPACSLIFMTFLMTLWNATCTYNYDFVIFDVQDHDTGEDDDDSDQERAEQAELLKKKKRKKPNKTKQQKEMDQWAKMMASHFEDVQQFHLSFD